MRLQEYNKKEEDKVKACFGSFRERHIFGDDDDYRRADLEFCFSPGLSKMIFEFKLGRENQNQVIEYANSSEDSIVISIAKEILRIDHYRIVQLTWNDRSPKSSSSKSP